MNFINQNLLEYCEDNSSSEPSVLKEINRKTFITQLNPRMVSGHLQGTFLRMLTQLINPTNVLEIGTYTGYSAVCIAMALHDKAQLHSIEVDEELKKDILNNFDKSGVGHKIELHIGDAIEIIPELTKNIVFDLVFIDADKENYENYFNLIRGNLKKGGVIIADNVLWSGKVLDSIEIENDPDTAAIYRFNSMIQADDSFEKVVLPIRDGITIAIKN